MGVFQYEKVKDPTYYGENRVPAHSDHRYYGSVEEMEQHVENFRHSLNGLWKFHYAKNYESTIPGFETPEYDCTKWDDIRVPAHIQMEGYDAPQYANVQYPWEGREEIQPGEIPERFNPTASYVKYFEVPDQMKGKRLFVSFQGAESGIAAVSYTHLVYKGALYENVVGEALVKSGYRLYYYKRDDSSLEQDFFVRTANALIPVEVKAQNGMAKSIRTLISGKKYADIHCGIKFTGSNMGYGEQIYTFPYFCAFLLKRYLAGVDEKAFLEGAYRCV